MIVKDDFLSKLRRYFNLNLYEVKIWVALLSRGVSTAGELSDIANVPRSRSYDILESLEKKGFITQKIGKPIKYIALPPHEVVERVKKNVKNEAEESVKRLESLKNTEVINELTTLHTQGVELVEPSDLTGSLRGRHNLYNHIEMTLKEAEKQVIIMTTEQGSIRKIDSMMPIFEDLHKRGVKIKIATKITKNNEKHLKDLSKIAEIRDTETKARFIIVDNQELIFMIANDTEVHPSYDVGLWINTPFFANALSELFNIAWKELKPLEVVLKN